MITPALDLQGASQLIDQLGAQSSQPADATSGGEFGEAFAASLSGTSAAAGSSSGGAAIVPLVPKALASNQFDGSVRPIPSKTAASTARPTQAATSQATSRAASQKTGSLTLSLLDDRAGIAALQKESEVPPSAASAKAAVATSLVKSSAQQTPEGTGVSLEAQERSLETSNTQTGSVEGKEIASASSQGVLVDASGPNSAVKAKASQSVSRAEGTESLSKSKAAGQALSQTPSHPVISSTTNGVLVADLGAGASSGTSIATSVSSNAAAHGLNVGGGTVPVLSSQLVQSKPTIPGLITTRTALAAREGTEAGRSGALAAWGSVEPTGLSTAKAASSRDLSGQLPQAPSASEAGSSGKSAPGGVFALPSSQLAANADRSTSVAVPTSFTISGEPGVPSIANDSPGAAAGGRPGLTAVSSVESEAVSGFVQSAGVASTGSLAANPQTTTPVSATAVSKTSSAKANVSAGQVQPGGARTGVAGGSVTASGAPTNAERISAQVAAGSESQKLPSVLNARPAQALNGDVQAASTRVLPVSSAVSQLSTAHSAVLERAKVVAAPGSASLPAPTSASHDSSDRGVSNDASSSVATSHVAGVAAVDHVLAPVSFDGAGGAAAVASSLASSALHPGPVSTPVVSAQPANGAVGSLGSLTATAETEPGHSADATHFAVASEPHQTLEATPTSLEVGVHSGTQGWLKIRAEVGGEGQVSASLAANSPSGEQILKGQLPALNAYLHSEQISLTASIAERTGIAHGAVAHNAGGSTLQAGSGSTGGQDASLLQSGAGQSGMAHGGRSGSEDASATRTGVESRMETQGQYEVIHDGQIETVTSALQSTTQAASGQWLNVTV